MIAGVKPVRMFQKRNAEPCCQKNEENDGNEHFVDLRTGQPKKSFLFFPDKKFDRQNEYQQN
jgi:hypothetical protein